MLPRAALASRQYHAFKAPSVTHISSIISIAGEMICRSISRNQRLQLRGAYSDLALQSALQGPQVILAAAAWGRLQQARALLHGKSACNSYTRPRACKLYCMISTEYALPDRIIDRLLCDLHSISLSALCQPGSTNLVQKDIHLSRAAQRLSLLSKEKDCPRTFPFIVYIPRGSFTTEGEHVKATHVTQRGKSMDDIICRAANMCPTPLIPL